MKSQGSLYLEFIPKDELFHKMLLNCRLWDFKLVDVTLSYNVILPEFRIFYLEMIPIWLKKSAIIEKYEMERNDLSLNVKGNLYSLKVK